VLVEIIDGTDYIYYTYDANDQRISMNYQDVEYFYVYDLQGNVTELIDITGQIVVRYRYDEESNLYYLQSRYYDPEIGRFINKGCEFYIYK